MTSLCVTEFLTRLHSQIRYGYCENSVVTVSDRVELEMGRDRAV